MVGIKPPQPPVTGFDRERLRQWLSLGCTEYQGYQHTQDVPAYQGFTSTTIIRMRSSKERIKRSPTACMQKIHTGSHNVMWLLSLCSHWELLSQGKEAAGRKGNLPRRQLAHDTEEAEPPPCPGQASLFWRFKHQNDLLLAPK